MDKYKKIKAIILFTIIIATTIFFLGIFNPEVDDCLKWGCKIECKTCWCITPCYYTLPGECSDFVDGKNVCIKWQPSK